MENLSPTSALASVASLCAAPWCLRHVPTTNEEGNAIATGQTDLATTLNLTACSTLQYKTEASGGRDLHRQNDTRLNNDAFGWAHAAHFLSIVCVPRSWGLVQRSLLQKD